MIAGNKSVIAFLFNTYACPTLKADPIGALASLQLGRAYVVDGNNAKAKSAYQSFFELWKDADPSIPILKQAKTEYAKLQ